MSGNSHRELMLSLVTNEVNLGLLFASAARAAFSMGDAESGDEALTKAEAAYWRAKRLQEHESEQLKTVVSRDLEALRKALDELPGEE